MTTTCPINVAVRLRPARPPSELEIPTSVQEVIWVTPPSTLQIHHASRVAGKSAFEFDTCFASSATNAQVFSKLGPPLVHAALSGINASLFCYGQTSSGKTYTMFGSPSDEGLAQRTIRTLMTELARESATVHASQYEIYNERVRDLLEERSDIRVREHPVNGPYIEGLTRVQVTGAEDCLRVLSLAVARSTKGETKTNAHSSRSHVIFQLDVSLERDQGDGHVARFDSRLSLVDLAGSERTQKSHAQGTRLKEAANINTSLMTLGLVINALSQNENDQESNSPGQSGEHVPYRNSVLTWLLRDSLGGNAQTTILATISPDARDLDESLSTLRYAERAKQIVNKTLVNVDPASTLILQLKEEIKRLQSGHGQASNKDFVQQLREAEARAAQAEKDSRERAELIWQSAETLRNEMTVAIEAAQRETQAALDKQEREEILPLVDECSALRIQCAWRRYQGKRLARLLEAEQRLSHKHNDEARG